MKSMEKEVLKLIIFNVERYFKEIDAELCSSAE